MDENASFVEGNYENELVLVLDSAFNYYPKKLIQAKKHKINACKTNFL